MRQAGETGDVREGPPGGAQGPDVLGMQPPDDGGNGLQIQALRRPVQPLGGGAFGRQSPRPPSAPSRP